MESSEQQGRATQVAAWLGVGAIHAGLFWLLMYQGGTSQDQDLETRLRLVFVQPARRTAVGSTPLPAPPRLSISSRVPFAPRPIDEAVSPAPPSTQSAFNAPAETLVDQVRKVATDQAPVSFASDPLRNRQAQLPGGTAATASG